MKQKYKNRFSTSMLLVFQFVSANLFSQNYFDFFYSNIPKSKINSFSSAFSKGLGWLGTGNYTSPAACSDCFDYSRDSKLTKTRLDSLVRQYKEKAVSKIYAKQYVPNNYYYATEKQETSPYIIKTLYEVLDSIYIVVQIKITFYERPNKLPGIADIEIMEKKEMKSFDPKIVLTSYHQRLKEDSKEVAPKVERQ